MCWTLSALVFNVLLFHLLFGFSLLCLIVGFSVVCEALWTALTCMRRTTDWNVIDYNNEETKEHHRIMCLLDFILLYYGVICCSLEATNDSTSNNTLHGLVFMWCFFSLIVFISLFIVFNYSWSFLIKCFYSVVDIYPVFCIVQSCCSSFSPLPSSCFVWPWFCSSVNWLFGN